MVPDPLSSTMGALCSESVIVSGGGGGDGGDDGSGTGTGTGTRMR